jgi:hypothetical protein
MNVVVTVIALLAVTAVGAFLIHRLNSQHGYRAAGFHYGPFGTAVPGPAPTSGRRARARATATADADGGVHDAVPVEPLDQRVAHGQDCRS